MPVSKTPAKKTPAKKTSAKKTPAKKTAARATKTAPKAGSGIGGAKPATVRELATRKDEAPSITAEERRRLVERAAYFRAEKRGFAPGYELEDWIEAEVEVLRLIGEA